KRDIWLVVLEFEVNGRKVVQRAMGALAIVEGFDVIEDLGSSLGASAEAAAVNQLQFEGAPEAFHGGVVITVTSATHRGDQAGLSQGLTIIAAGVLNAAIGMEQQVGGGRSEER